MKPMMVTSTSSSQSSSSSSSSVDSTTGGVRRMHNHRVLNTTYSYTAIGANDELMPTEFDDNNDDIHSGVELMMTTV